MEIISISDDAGTNAALRAIPVLVKSGFRVRVTQVPDGKDPDEFIKANGAAEFSKLLVNADSFAPLPLCRETGALTVSLRRAASSFRISLRESRQ